MLVDSHCHLDFPELASDIPGVLADMEAHGVSFALCVAVTLQDFPAVKALADAHENLYASVGTHPDYPDHPVVTPEELVSFAAAPKVIGIGETGLDYYRLQGDLEWQRERFRAHIRAAVSCGKPLIIHTRAAAADTLSIMREEGAERAGGVMHCFTETWDTAKAALDMGFHISFSGIVTFRNAAPLREVARQVPADRLLVETDSPYLAPVPYRGKTNRPGWVRYVAEEVAKIRGVSFDALADATTDNFFRLFKVERSALRVN
jgi:TatD DNase family protein